MTKSKLFIMVLTASALLFAPGTMALAEEKIGLVDVRKILSDYDKAKAAQDELKANQEEIKKMLAQARKQLQSAKSDKDKDKIQQEFKKKVTQKTNLVKEKFSRKWETVQNEVLATIKQVAEKEGLTLVVDKQSVIAGGEDITDKVLSVLD